MQRQGRANSSAEFRVTQRATIARLLQIDSVSLLNQRLADNILSYNPRSVFEFGCGVGKNLELLKERIPNHLGLDISSKAVDIASKKQLNVICRD